MMKIRPDDTTQFTAALDGLRASLTSRWSDYFDSPHEVIVTRAPGRLDLMGGIADYCGSLMLPWPIQNATHVAIQRRSDTRLRIASLPSGQEEIAAL